MEKNNSGHKGLKDTSQRHFCVALSKEATVPGEERVIRAALEIKLIIGWMIKRNRNREIEGMELEIEKSVKGI